MSTSAPRGLLLAVFVWLVSCGLHCAYGQGQPQEPVSVEQRIQHVTSGLIGKFIVNGANDTQTLADRMEELNVPGVSIAVIHNGRIEWARAFGVRTIGGEPVDAQTMFQAGSISKPVTAMAVLKLVQDGKLFLDTDVNTYLTSWKLPRDPVAGDQPVTIRELLTHTAGITVHGFSGYARNEPVPTLVQVLNGEWPANSPPIRSGESPGKEWSYSGGGYIILQQVLIDVTHEPFPQLMRETVLDPIDMSRSTYEQPLPPELQANFATPYRAEGYPVAGGPHTYPEMAAAGLWTTPTDIAKYAIEVEQSLAGHANHVLSPAVTQQMLTPGMGNWGLGVQIGGSPGMPFFSHGGSNEGYENVFVAYERSGDGAVVMTNGDNGEELANEVMHSIAMEYVWPDWKPHVLTCITVDKQTLGQYAGVYEIKPGYNAAISFDNGQLFGQVAGQEKVALYAESPTKFFAFSIADKVITETDFIEDASGHVNALLIHMQDGSTINARRITQ